MGITVDPVYKATLQPVGSGAHSIKPFILVRK